MDFGTVLYANSGRVVGHHEAFLYEDPDPKSTYNAYYGVRRSAHLRRPALSLWTACTSRARSVTASIHYTGRYTLAALITEAPISAGMPW